MSTGSEEIGIDIITDYISYSEFYHTYLLTNKPCLLSAAHTKDWPCRHDWVQDGEPNMDYFKEKYAHLTAPVLDCNKQAYSSHEKYDMRIAEFTDYWKDRNDKLYYLKDWHLQMKERDNPFYNVHEYFTSDWLNEYWDKVRENDDYRFVYLGVRNTWTPFHADVFRSFSWSANICGLKKWLLYEPGDEHFLRDKFGNLPFDVTAEVDVEMYPNCEKAKKPIIVHQKAGEVIFLPSGWHHQVYNIEDTMSINHNWVNACCIDKMFLHLCNELIKVEKEISDCQDMDGFHVQCQLILKASSGMDFKEFYEMITYLVKTRLRYINDYDGVITHDSLPLLSTFYITSVPGLPFTFENGVMSDSDEQKNYILFDLNKLKIVLKQLIEHEDFNASNGGELISEGEKLLEEIDNVINGEKN